MDGKAPSLLTLSAPQHAIIHTYLLLWSEYVIQTRGESMGFSSCVAWARLALKPSSYHSVTLIPITYDEYDRVNQLVMSLHETQQAVLTEEYCFVGARYQKAAALGIAEQTFRWRLQVAFTALYNLGLCGGYS